MDEQDPIEVGKVDILIASLLLLPLVAKSVGSSLGYGLVKYFLRD